MKLNKYYKVEWVDATSHAGWTEIADLALSEITSLGKLVKETKEYIALAGSFGETQVNNTMVIPRAWVKKVKELKIAKES